MSAKLPILPLRRGIAAAGLCLVLSACDNPLADQAPSLESILSGGWLFGEEGEPAPPRASLPVYCYATIGDGDCHDSPLEDGGNRLIGFQGPPPPIDLMPE